MASLRKSLSFVRKLVGESAVTVSEGALALGDRVLTDIEQAERALVRAKVAGTSEELVTALTEVDRLTSDGLLSGWEEHWITPFRDEWERKRVGALASLADVFRQHGQPEGALPHAMRCAELEPLSEAHAARVIGLLAELGRHAEAEDYFRAFADRLETELDVNVSPTLTALARDVRKRAGSGREVDAGILGLIAQKVFLEDPGKLVSILASQGLSWVMFSHANEVFPVAVRALEATSGWTADRKRLAIDTIQLANFLGRYAEMNHWIGELSAGVEPGTYEQAVCQCMTAISAFQMEIEPRIELCNAARATAAQLGNSYLGSLVDTTVAGIYMEAGHYQKALDMWLASAAELEVDASQRGRKYLASVLGGMASASLMLGDNASAAAYCERAIVIASVAGVSDMESGDRAVQGFLRVLAGNAEGTGAITQSMAACIRQRNFRVTLQNLMLAAAAMSAMRKNPEATRLAATALDFANQFGTVLSFRDRDFLSRFAHAAQPSPNESLLREMSLPSIPSWLAQR